MRQEAGLGGGWGSPEGWCDQRDWLALRTGGERGGGRRGCEPGLGGDRAEPAEAGAGVSPSLSGGSSFSGPSSALSMARARFSASRTPCSSWGSAPARTWVRRSCTSWPTAVWRSCISAAAARPTCRSGASSEQKAALMERSKGRLWPRRGEVKGLPWGPCVPSSSELLGEPQSTSWREGRGGRLGLEPPGTRYPTELSLRSSWRGADLSVWLGVAPGGTGTGGGGPAGGDRGLEVSVDTRTLKLLLNFSRLVGPRSPGNRGLKKHRAAPVPWSSSCGDRGFSRGSSGPSDGPGRALVLREELQNSREEQPTGASEEFRGDGQRGQGTGSDRVPTGLPFPPWPPLVRLCRGWQRSPYQCPDGRWLLAPYAWLPGGWLWGAEAEGEGCP